MIEADGHHVPGQALFRLRFLIELFDDVSDRFDRIARLQAVPLVAFGLKVMGFAYVPAPNSCDLRDVPRELFGSFTELSLVVFHFRKREIAFGAFHVLGGVGDFFFGLVPAAPAAAGEYRHRHHQQDRCAPPHTRRVVGSV
jgi:hypothetical protein